MTTTRADLAARALDLALAHVGKGDMVSSAQLAADDAAACLAGGDFEHAIARATTSLAYSVGVFHVDHMRASLFGATVAVVAALGAYREVRNASGPWSPESRAAWVAWELACEKHRRAAAACEAKLAG